MNATEPMNVDQAADLLVQPEIEESQLSEEPTAEVESEQPDQDSDVEAEAEEETEGYAEDESDDDEGEEVESEDEEYEAENDDDELEDDESEEPEDALYTVKVNGVEEQVTLEDLKRGYSGQKYVQIGMQEAAKQRKQAEEVYTTLLQQSQQLESLIANVQDGGLTPPEEPSRELRQTDPIRYMEEKMDYDDKLKVYQQNVLAVQAQQQQQSKAAEAARQAYANQQAELLKKEIPELSDPKQAETFKGNMVKTAEHFGYSADEVAQITNGRDIMVLRAAMNWLQLQEKGDIVREKTKKARKPLKTSAKKVVTQADKRKKQYDKLRQSGSMQDAMAMILDPKLR
mgnify:CR=1 FL=1